MERCYILEDKPAIAIKISESCSAEDFNNIRNNYCAELSALRKRYSEKMIECVRKMDLS